MKIAIEGMDGVGKSTIAKMVAAKYNCIYLEKPLQELFDTPSVNGKDNLGNVSRNIYKQDDETLKAWFFGLGNLYSFMKYDNEDLVVDRHFVSNYFWNGTEKTKPIFQLMKNYISVPDITILLYASPKTRLRRIYRRDKDDYDLQDEEKHVDGYDKMIDFLNEFEIPYEIVNTENKGIDEVFQEVDLIISRLKQKEEEKKMVKSCD